MCARGDITETHVDAVVLDNAARIAVTAVRATPTAVTEVRFVLFDDAALAAFETAAST